MVERRRLAFSRRVRGSKPPPLFRSLGNFVHPTLPVSFGRDSKAVSPFYLVYMPGEVHLKWKQTVVDSLTLEKDTHKTRRTTLKISVLLCALMCYLRC